MLETLKDLAHLSQGYAVLNKGQQAPSWMIQAMEPHFHPDEFRCPDSGVFIYDMSAMASLKALRRACMFPFQINSGTRSANHNKAIGGHPNSAHMVGRAFDIKLLDRDWGRKIISMAGATGFRGVGLKLPIGADTGYIHLDNVPRSGYHDPFREDENIFLWTYP